MTKAKALRGMLRVSSSAWLAALFLGVAGVLAACGGGGVVPATQPGGMRALPDDYSTRKAVNYSPYRTENRDTEVVTRDNVLQDLGLLAQGGFTLIRTFDSSDEVAGLLLQIIKDNRIDIKVQLGIYLAPTAYGTPEEVAAARRKNDDEIARAIRLAADFDGIVISVSVGNESVGFGRTTPEVMADYLALVRANVTQAVTMNDVWDAFAPGPGGAGMPPTVTNLLDFVSMHSYPILTTNQWDWEQQAVPESERAAAMMAAAVQRVVDSYAAVRKHLNGQAHFNMPIVVGETGWKAVATSDALTYLAHPANQKMYYDGLVAWSDSARAGADGPVSIFYFEAFDEPWKAVADPNFDDDKWGLFTVERQARFVIQNLFPTSQWAPGNYTLADAVYAPTVVSSVITADRYTVYADAVTPGEAIAPAAQWFGFDSPPNAFAGEGTDAALAAEGTHFMEVGPVPSSYGWGVVTTNNTRADLSQFLAAGRLNFSIKTTYPGRLMFGFGTAADGAVFVVASNTNADGYGYVNDGNWHQVSIPISAFTAAGANFDLSRLTNAIVIADIYDRTGNTARGDSTKVFIDAVYWSK
jgi:exo-beta-1,3-glucanase (GH17 family)